MAFQRPTLEELRGRTSTDVATRTGQGPLLRRSVLGVLAHAMAAAAHALYGYLAWVVKQPFADTADGEYLERQGAIYGVNRKAATFATGTVDFTGADGATIPAGTRAQRADGVGFETDADAVISRGAAAVAVTAVDPGTDSVTPADTSLTLVSPVASVQATATVATGGIGGSEDAETDEQLRERVLARLRHPPRGGAAHDYVAWAKEVAGVTRAWALPLHLGIGTVGVAFMRDDDADPFPDAAAVAEVQAHLEEHRPVTALVTAFAPSAVPLDFEVQLTPSTAETQAAVSEALRDLLGRAGAPGGTVLLSHIREGISTTPGETDHVLVSPVADVIHNPGELPVMGDVTWS